jgi:F420-dependent oxidoreductase-like protein
MRFAIKTNPQRTTFEAMLDVWRAADELPIFESAWTFDHMQPISEGGALGPCLEGWITTAALAQATSRIRVGVLVTGNVYRHPAVLAKMACTLDVISGGRLEFGLGAGWHEPECAAYGIDLPPLAERFDRLEEAIEMITTLMVDDVAEFTGRHYRLTHARCEPKPVQQPHPPIVVGGAGERRTLRIVARWADHWNLPNGDVGLFVAKRDVLRQHCADLGRDPTEITTSVQVRLDPANLSGVVREAEQFAAVGLDLFIIQLPPPHTSILLGPLADSLRHLADPSLSRSGT